MSKIRREIEREREREERERGGGGGARLGGGKEADY